MAGAENNVSGIIEKFEERLNDACEKLTADIAVHEGNRFDKDGFWSSFVSATKLISHEATKFCLAFDSGSMTSKEECQSLIDRVENSCLTLLAIYFILPKTRGKIFHRRIRLYVLNIVHGMKSLCTAIRNQSSQLQNVGDVWAICESVEHLPKDNKDAVLELCQEQLDMVQDASQELMAAMEETEVVSPPLNGLPVAESWSDTDRHVLLPSSGLVKAAKACIKKTRISIMERGNGDSEVFINELDQIADVVKTSSSMVDDFVLSLYPPMNHSAVREQASLVRNNSKKLLQSVKNCHFCCNLDEAWIEFLEKAVDHNWVRINDTLLTD